MNFLKRLYYYSTGFIIGIIFLFFILNGKRASCNYTPNARVIDNITSKELIIDSNRETFFNQQEIIEILNSGKVIFNKSEPNREPCGMYYIKSGDFKINVINCENEATVRIN
tara:strand:- start:197 stop:532 length:336 start_codon:yes stop_codon:yes gene_type:complete